MVTFAQFDQHSFVLWHDSSMAEACFRRKDSNPSLCGVQNVPLVQRQSSENSGVSKYGDFEFLMCPVSRKVVDEVASNKWGTTYRYSGGLSDTGHGNH